MPITITLPQPGNSVGPGFVATFQTDFIGPLPSDSFWILNVSRDSEGEESILVESPHGVSHTLQWMWQARDNAGLNEAAFDAAIGSEVHVIATLIGGSTTIDSGATTGTWQPTTGLANVVVGAADNITATGGFTTTDRDALALAVSTIGDVLNGITLQVQTTLGLVQQSLAEFFSGRTLDLLTLIEVTDGPTGEQVVEPAVTLAYGVIIRVTTIPPYMSPQTPDGDYYLPDLAVMRLFRGSDLWIRRPIHTSSWMEENLASIALATVSGFGLRGFPPEVTMYVDWARGVEGRVYLMRFP